MLQVLSYAAVSLSYLQGIPNTNSHRHDLYGYLIFLKLEIRFVFQLMEDGLLGVSGVSVLFAVLKDFNVGVVSVTIQFLLMEELLVLEMMDALLGCLTLQLGCR